MSETKEIYDFLPLEPIDVASMLIKATMDVNISTFSALSPMLENKLGKAPKYDTNQLQEIAGHLLVYCETQERGCADACCENYKP